MSYDAKETCSVCNIPKWTVGVFKEMTDVCIDCYRTRLLQQGFGSVAVGLLTNSRTRLPTNHYQQTAQKTPPSSGAALARLSHAIVKANPVPSPPGNTPLVVRAPKEHCKNWCDLCTFFGTQCAKHRPLAAAVNTPLSVRRHARRVISDDGAFIFLVLLTVAGLAVIALLLAGVIH